MPRLHSRRRDSPPYPSRNRRLGVLLRLQAGIAEVHRRFDRNHRLQSLFISPYLTGVRRQYQREQSERQNRNLLREEKLRTSLLLRWSSPRLLSAGE